MLEFTDVHVRYGHVEALRGVSLRVERGEIVALLGNNGAGKSTTLCAASALVPVASGSIVFDGEPLPGKPWHVVRGGLVHVPEGRRVFSTLTVLENLQLGGFAQSDKAEVARRIDGVFDLLPLLAKRRAQQGGTLSGGEQQLVAIGRALVAAPRVLMLDEPSMGLAPLMVAAVMDVVRKINAEGTTVLLVEQNARAALGITHRGYVLENGVVTLSGPASVLAEDPRVVEAYLGS